MPPIHDATFQLIRRIALNVAPDEIELLETEGKVLIRETLQGKEQDSAWNNRDEFRFGLNDLVEPIKLIALILGTAKTISDLLALRTKKKSVPALELQQRWKEKLCEAGIEPALAEKISADFRSDLAAMIEGA